eukprot:scaffold10022_cov73-Cylindrotheca_fusiformis.AAC.1
MKTIQIGKPGIDRLLDLLDIHWSALQITRQFIGKVKMVHGETLLDIRHHSFEGHPLQRELEDQYMQVYEYYGGNKLLREVGSNYRLSEDDGPFFEQRPPIDRGRGCLLDY